jgi:hypothetical protein
MARDLLPSMRAKEIDGKGAGSPRCGSAPGRAQRTIGSEPCAYCFAFAECWRAAQW